MEQRLAERVERALLELVIEIRDPDRTAIELPRRDQKSLRTLWNVMSRRAPQGSAVRDPLLIDFLLGKLRKQPSSYKALRIRVREWIGWRVWSWLVAHVVFVPFVCLQKGVIAATLPWIAYPTAACMGLASLLILFSTEVIQQISRIIMALLPALAITFTLAGLLSDTWNPNSEALVLLPATTVALLCIAVARITLGDGADQAIGLPQPNVNLALADALFTGDKSYKRRGLSFLLWTAYGLLSYLSILIGGLLIVDTLDKPSSIPESFIFEALIPTSGDSQMW
jgi:hypothetical protein